MPLIAPDLARLQREREVENALATNRMEGLEPPEEAMLIFQRYADGELSLEQMGRAVDQLLDREHGPLRISRDDRT